MKMMLILRSKKLRSPRVRTNKPKAPFRRTRQLQAHLRSRLLLSLWTKSPRVRSRMTSIWPSRRQLKVLRSSIRVCMRKNWLTRMVISLSLLMMRAQPCRTLKVRATRSWQTCLTSLRSILSVRPRHISRTLMTLQICCSQSLSLISRS